MRKPIFLLFVILFICGCASPIKKTGYLQNYESLHKGKYLESYWSNTTLINQRKYSRIRVEAINIDRISDQKGVTTEDCRRWLHNSLLNATRSLRDHFLFETTTEAAQLKLAVAITEMTPGSAAGRIFAGELGMGHAWVQVEGRVVDEEKNEEVAVFSDRRRSSGAIGFADSGGDAGPGLVSGMLDQIAVDMIQELKESFGF